MQLRVLGIGHQHGDELGVEVLRALGQLPAVHVRHAQISEEEAYFTGVSFEETEGGAAIVATARLIPQGSYHTRDGRAGTGLVINNQDQRAGIEGQDLHVLCVHGGLQAAACRQSALSTTRAVRVLVQAKGSLSGEAVTWLPT